MAELQDVFDAIVNGNAKAARALTEQALQEGISPGVIISEYMIPAMDAVGNKFECEEYFVPELLLSSRAMKSALELLRPLLAASGAQPVGRVIIGTVKGDLHDIGKNLVTSMLEGGGFEVHDLGSDVPPERFVQAIEEHKPDIVALSALLTVTMGSMRSTIEALSRACVREQVKVMVGGAPVTADFATQIGADGYSESASSAVALARSLLREGRAE